MRHVRIRRPDHTCKRWSPLCVAGPNFCHLSRAQGANLPLTLCQCAGTISSSSWRRRAPRTTPGRLGGVAGPASAGANGSATIYLSTQADRKKTCEGGEGSRRDRESGARGSGSRRARGRGRASLHHRHEPCQWLAPWLMSRHSRDPGLPGNLTPDADDLPRSLADLDDR